jgi:membrane protease YdiL (CAAX protease family)
MDTNACESPREAIEEHPPVETRPAPARPLRVWPVFAIYFGAFAMCAAVQIPVAVVMAVVVVLRGGKPDEIVKLMGTPLGFIALALPAQLGLLGVWWWASTYGDPRVRASRAIGQTMLSAPALVCIVIASLAALYLGDPLSEVGLQLFGQWGSDTFITRLYDHITWPTGIALVLFIGLAPAFVEEFFFRGYMQRRLLARWPAAVVVPLVAVLFAAFHGTPAWALGVLPLGLWFGVLAWRTGSLWPGIACHAFINGSVTGWRAGVALGALPDHVPSAVFYVFLGAAFACLAASAVILWRGGRPNRDYQRTADADAPIASGSNPQRSASDSMTTSGR